MTDQEPAGLELMSERAGKKYRITARIGTEVVFVDTTDPASAAARGKFAKALLGKCPALRAESIDAELLRLAASGSGARPTPNNAASPGAPTDTPPEIRRAAEELLDDPELICRICDDVAAVGVVGERELSLTVFLIGVSRLLPKPLSGIVRGSSSSGKSFLIESVVSLFPAEAVINATQMTPQALFHMPPDSLRNKWVVGGERSRLEDDDRAEATRGLREMQSAGRLSKLMPMKVDGGRIETVSIEQEGPLAFVESTTLTEIFEEDANRCLLLQTDESEEQTRRIVVEGARRHTTPRVDSLDRLRAVHHAAQRMLPTVEVRVPFADRIAGRLECRRVEVRRAFPQLLALIQASALLHHRQRSRDADGTVLAAPTDYQIARRLIARSFAVSLGGGVTDSALQLFRGLRAWVPGEFTARDVTKRGLAGKSSAYARLSELHDAGAVELVEPGRGRNPARWRLTGAEPDPGAAILPAVGEVFPELDSARTHGSNSKPAELQGV